MGGSARFKDSRFRGVGCLTVCSPSNSREGSSGCSVSSGVSSCGRGTTACSSVVPD